MKSQNTKKNSFKKFVIVFIALSLVLLGGNYMMDAQAAHNATQATFVPNNGIQTFPTDDGGWTDRGGRECTKSGIPICW